MAYATPDNYQENNLQIITITIIAHSQYYNTDSVIL